jgi:type IV pilus assembly protein PilM
MDQGVTNPTIYGCIRVPTPEGVVEDGTIKDVVELGRRIRSACRDKSIRTTDAIFTVVSSKIATRETTIPAVSKAKIEQLVMAKVPDLFPVDPENYVFSHILQGKEYFTEDASAQKEPEPEMEEEQGGKKNKKAKKNKKDAAANKGSKVQDVRIFAAPEELIQSYYALANAAGLNIVAVDADGNGMFQIMRRQVDRGICMSIQINRDGTLVNIIDSEKLYLQRVIPYGVSSFTDAMIQDEAFKVADYDEAFHVLTTQRVLLPTLNAENNSDDESLNKRIDVTNNGDFLINNINRVVEYYNSHYRDAAIERIICIGQGSNIAGLNALISNELGIPVETPQELASIHFNRKVSVDAALLQYVNCFGSVFDPVNLVPKEIARKEASKGGLTTSITVLVGCVVISVVLVGFSLTRLALANSANTTATKKYNAMAPIQGQYDNLKQIQANYVVVESLQTLLATNNNYFHTLINELSDIVPEKFRIQSIQSDEDSVTISATTEDKLSSLSALEIQLKALDGVKDVSISAISQGTSSTGRKQYQYSLTFAYDNTDRDEAIENIRNNTLSDTTEISDLSDTEE